MTLTALRRTSFAVAAVLVLGAASTARAISLGQTAKLDGIIATRSGASMTLKTEDQGSVTVLLTENTDVNATKGRLGLIKKGAAATALIPGLKGYLLGVEGFADASGNASVNQKLSLERSQAVVNWLAQQAAFPSSTCWHPGP